MSYNYGTLLCNKLQIEYNGNAGIMSTITQTSKDSLYIDGPVIIGGDLTVSGTINGETGGGGGGGGATITASDGNGVYSYANITYDNGNITNITSNPTPIAGSTITASSGNGTYTYANITYNDGNITNIVSNPAPTSGSSITATSGNGTYDYATITYSDGNITNIVSNPIPVTGSTITATGGNATYSYCNVTYENGNITNITSNPTPTGGGSTITAPANGTYNYATIAYSNGDITNITSNDNISVTGKVQSTEVDTQLIKLSEYSKFSTNDDTQKAIIQCTGGDLKIQPPYLFNINLNGPVNCKSTFSAPATMQSGVGTVYNHGTITFPQAFNGVPSVVATPSIIVSTGGVWRGFLGVYNVTTTSFDITLWQSDFKDPNADWTFYWIAMVSYY